MADNRFNHGPGFSGGGFQVGPQNPAMHSVPGMTSYMQAGMPMNPMMQQQMMMAPGMRFPMQGMRMGPPNTPPPPYHAHNANVANMPNRPRASLSKSKEGGQQSEKERFFEEQRRKLKQFGKPGATKVDEGKLIGSIFSAEAKPAPSRGNSVSNSQSFDDNDDDGFGDFLQGPSIVASVKKEDVKLAAHESVEVLAPGPEPKHQEEKKDLTSIMLEYSDLSAPKKAKGFHKPTLNEVQKSVHEHHRTRATNFHESDHARSWTRQAEDLEGLFQLPVQPKPTPPVVAQTSQPPQSVYPPPGTVPSASHVPAYQAVSPQLGPPPSYSEAAAGLPNATTGNPTGVGSGQSVPASHGHTNKEPVLTLPEWCALNEEQMPPVYKHVWEASLVENKISTERLYPILLLSGLPREKLAHIWSLCNTSTPGQLVKHELWLVLALVALTQHNYNTNTLDILARCPVAPVPVFAFAQGKSDTNTPATLPTTPMHHQVHAPHPTPAPIKPNSPTAHPSSPQPGNPQQFHSVHQPKPQIPRSASTPSATHSRAPVTSSAVDDDDFADFQAAAPVSNVGKDEAFGEFIGGGGSTVGGVGTGGFSFSSPVTSSAHHIHLGNGSLTTGVPLHNPLQQQPPSQQQPPQQQPTKLSLASLPVDDKYGTNVRSFFCSSDSSTGHTSPSFEDDDFTDGQDSLSQVSTSEQSENEDLRNFESYVEEFHQKKELPDGSPLHCPFPNLQQNQNLKHAKAPQMASLPNISALGSMVSGAPVDFKTAQKFNAAPANPGLANFNMAAVSSKLSANLAATSPTRATQDDDFTDFKSASHLAPASSASVDGSLIGDEDKYGALRVLTLDNLTQPSLFEQPAKETTSPLRSESAAEESDEWADFSAAAPIGNDGSSSFATPGAPASKKDDILKLFSSDPICKSPITFSGGNSSEVTSEGGSKNGSLFGDDLSAVSTPCRSKGPDTGSVGDQLSSSSFSEHDSAVPGSNWGPETSKTDDNWASFGGLDDAALDRVYEQPGYFNDGKVNKLGPVGEATTAGPFSPTRVVTPVHGGTNDQSSVEWGSFPRSPSSASSNTSVGNTVHQQSHGGWKAGNITLPAPAGQHADEDDEWSHFSSADVPADVPVKTDQSDEEAVAPGEAKFVTIKKQNLGTNEIMGLFKVRDDPATLSSYQLPPQVSTSKVPARSSHHHTGSASNHNHRMPSDEDMGPPPLDYSHDEDDDDHTFARGYDFDDSIHQGPPVTIYSPFGMTHSSPIYGTSGGMRKLKENKEDNASVHSLDLPSTRPADPYGSDSVSVSSADLNSSEMTGGGTGAVSAESKSLDSLDFKNDAGDSENSYSPKEDASSSHHHPIQPQELLASMPDFADKYNIEHEAQGSDRYGHEWERCLGNCCRIIMEANTLFNTISSSTVCNEVLKSYQGSEYVISVVEIYRVVCRVMTSMRSTAISTKDLEQTLKDIDLAWNNLAAFLVGASLLPEQSTLLFTGSVLKSDLEGAKHLACGVCLLSVDSNPASTAINGCKLTYAGRQYHAACANFWVNCVDQTLPSLTLPELL
ncbi:unnamed protein product [Lymnaea stagnalis]|uniref:EH domain-containing protein n=1 Tax=Lymnaea stagnalis TaxID=6523 RepID=A0AAV2HN60_LYMST